MIVDDFSGAGGWSVGILRATGREALGLDLDPWACATHRAAGFPTIRADVARYPAERFRGRLEGLTISPPCTDWSRAGLNRRTAGSTGDLVGQVLRWAAEARPLWLAAEQVDTVLPVWRAFEAPLRRLGYRTWSGILDAADYGVPQNRQRSILLAHLGAQPHPPAPTHAARPAAGLDGRQLERHVSMAEALGWTSDVYTGRDSKVSRDPSAALVPYRREADRPAPTVVGNVGRWTLRTGNHRRPSDRTRARPVDRPSPTIAFGHAAADWCWMRPATAVCGDPRIFAPGQHFAAGRDPDKAKGRSEDAIPVTLEEALVLQDFPAGYPIQGRTKAQRFLQVGNAVPPGLAAAIVDSLVRLRSGPRDEGPVVEDWRTLLPSLDHLTPAPVAEAAPPASLFDISTGV